MIYVAIWWLIIQILALAALPTTYWAFRWLPDRGYAFAKVVGLLLASYFLWLGAITGFLGNNLAGIIFSVLLTAGLSWFISAKYSGQSGKPLIPGLLQFLREHKQLVLVVELLFVTALIVWAALRAYAPDKIMSAGGEKFMEIAFLNGILNSQSFPPLDPWLSGFSISYYYFGYVMMGLLTRLSGAAPGVGFDLYDALLIALTLIGAFSIVYNLTAVALHKQTTTLREVSSKPLAYGILGALFVGITGNLEGFLESIYNVGWLPIRFWQWLDIPGLADSPASGSWFPSTSAGWWWWRASRIIQDYDLLGQPMGVSPITEFPFFSFLLGDNHPHVLALPFVLLAIGLSFNLLRRQLTINSGLTSTGVPSRSHWWNPAAFTVNGDWALLLFISFCLGSLGFLNTWDMPIYLGLITLAYGLGEYTRRRNLDRLVVARSVVLAFSLLLFAILLYLLFYLGFSSQAGGILPHIFPPTRLPQYLVFFGLFIFIITWYLVSMLLAGTKENPKRGLLRAALGAWLWVLVICIGIYLLFLLGAALAVFGSQFLQGVASNPVVQSVLGGLPLDQTVQRILAGRLSNPWLFLFISALVALAIIAATRLSIAPTPDSEEQPEGQEPSRESSQFASLMIFMALALTLSVEFIYLRDSFGVRMNTVFKFYYQAWVLMGCASAYAIYWILNEGKRMFGNASRIVFSLSAVLLIVASLVYPLMAGFSRVNGFEGLPNLDGTSVLAQNNPDDWAAINWLQQNAEGTPVILEAPGKSYNYEGRISAFTGFPTVLGWALHEAQWRGNYDEQAKREPDIATIYSTKDAGEALDLLHKWGVDYLIIGPAEMSYIQQLCSDPNRACNLSRALQKFETILTPVFQQGAVLIYEVPPPG